jgi:threonine/homoserine/homoserine lactone efflux protein
MASYGMWRARYWAVLGFDVVLVFLMIVAVGGLIEAKNALAAVVFTALIAGAGTLFYFMVKAMARIQMPERRTPGSG